MEIPDPSDERLIIGTSAAELNRDCAIISRNSLLKPMGLEAYLDFLTSCSRLFEPGPPPIHREYDRPLL